MTPKLDRVSSHVSERRWLQRSDNPIMDPVDAWADATPIYGHGLEGDEVRHHDHTGTVLVRKDDTLVTAIDVEGAKRSIRNAVRVWGGEQA
ncbi:hypothetical protein OB920_04965 [Halobacteria archaeon HArc-gm2]|nr:hypothetical protein [Halobacteria archaeon HArc-gm2]